MRSKKSIVGICFVLAMAMIVFMADCKTVKAADYSAWSSIFDATYYASHCADAKAYAGNNTDLLWQYFVKVGIPRGDQASEEFNVYTYAKNYPDLLAAYGGNFMNYYIHYAQAGKKEGRNAKTSLAASNNQQAANNTNKASTDTVNNAANNSATVTEESFQAQVVALVNEERANEGLSALSMENDALNQAAQSRASEIVDSFSHTRPNGSSCFTMLEEYGVSYSTAGENIAAGQITPEAVVNSWMNSAGHRANILNSSFGHIGVGYVKANSGYGSYWVQMFTN